MAVIAMVVSDVQRELDGFNGHGFDPRQPSWPAPSAITIDALAPSRALRRFGTDLYPARLCFQYIHYLGPSAMILKDSIGARLSAGRSLARRYRRGGTGDEAGLVGIQRRAPQVEMGDHALMCGNARVMRGLVQNQLGAACRKICGLKFRRPFAHAEVPRKSADPFKLLSAASCHHH
jgi:hypothetical protein